MCGITAIWGADDPALIRRMLERLAHRGPDATGIASEHRSTLGHSRLSIMDPGGGLQPIWNEDRSTAIVANGEIYNYSALKDSLCADHRFSTASDSEVPLHLYEELGSQMVNHIDGMFALVLTDGHELFAARDPVGIKPLYCARLGDQMLFASELKGFPERVTDVREVPLGTCFHTQTGFYRYRHLPRAEPEELPVEHWCRSIRATVERAVSKRLMSDVPLGAFLSGGLDSSIIAAVARREMDELHTFSIGLEGSRDLEAARLVAEHIDSIHHELTFTEQDIREHLPEIVFHLESFDQDLVRSAVPCYFVSRLAADHVKVILTGEGADELFAGYAYYKEYDEHMPLHEELHRSVSSLYNTNLQRVDRLTMAHSLEGRVPFLDLEMIELGQRIPAELKIRQQQDGTPVEKWILRKAFEGLLPEEIVWRTKEQFDEGSGTTDVLARVSEHFMTAGEARRHATAHRSDRIRGHEESVYHKVLCDAYANPAHILSNVARWQENRTREPKQRRRSGDER